MTEQDQSRDRPGDEMVRLTVAEAADRLGISAVGVRKRVQRNQIPHERGEDGRVFVWILPGETRHVRARDEPVQSRDELIDELRDRLRYVERQLEQEREARTEERRRHDTLMAQLLQRIPELEAPAEPRESPETAAEMPVGLQPSEAREEAQEPVERRSWRSRMFGG